VTDTTPEPKRVGLLLLLAACSAIGPVSTLMLIPALPIIRDEFGATMVATQPIISVFLLTFAIGIPLAGPLSDRYGRRPLLLGGLAVFIVGSLLAAVAPTIEVLVIARAIQAIGCAANATVARAILGDLYQDWRLSRALAQLTLGMMIGTSVSPWLGGLITESMGWHAPFVLLLVLSTITAVAAARSLPETRAKSSADGQFRELGIASMNLVRNRAFLGCVIDAGVMYALYLGFISTAPYIVKEMTGQPATTFGLYVLFLSSGYFLGNLYVSRLRGHAALDRVARFGTLLQAVTACAALAFVLFGFTAPIWWFLPMLPLAFAQGLALPHVTATAVRLAPGYAGVASGLIGFSQQAFAALTVQAMGVVPIDTPVPMLAICAALSLVSVAAVLLLDRFMRTRPAEGI